MHPCAGARGGSAIGLRRFDRIGDLMQAADLAAGLGADVISMSWGEQEHPGQSELERVFAYIHRQHL